jgi:hypothetical protein
MDTDEIVGQCLLWGDLRYITVEEFDAYVKRQEALEREVAELRARVETLESLLT